MILGICDEPSLMNVIRLIVLFINIIKVLVPIILIIALSIKLAGAVAKHSQEDVLKTVKSGIPNIIAAVLVFLVPTFVDIVARVAFPDSNYTKCVSGITKEDVDNAYKDKMEKLLDNAEQKLTYSDYSNAMVYLQNIKDLEKRADYAERLDRIKDAIDKLNASKETYNGKSEYARVNYSGFKWTMYPQNTGPLLDYYNNPVTYFVYGPEKVSDLNGVSLPLIVWLHGRGEIGTSGNILNSGLFKVVSDWSGYGLDPIPAIIVAAQSPQQGWISERNMATIRALVNYAKDHYHINSADVTLMGHSMGGFGAIDMAPKMKDLFSALVIMSGGENSSARGNEEYFSKIKMRGYAESNTFKHFFTTAKRESDFILYSGIAHGQIPKKVMTEDANKDNVSDLLYWLYGNKAIITKSLNEPEKTDDSSGSSTPKPPPTPNPITNYIDISSLNTSIASAVKSQGLYTRGAVVAAATTLINTLDSKGYYIPYQMGGMYHRKGKWGANPNWGTVITHKGEQVLSGLDCRNFVEWSFQQAGLCLVRGYGYEGSTIKDNYTANKYGSLTEGRPGDVIDHNKHIMLIVQNNGDGYLVAESNGVGRVRLHNITIASMKSFGYAVYNMDAIYDNTAAICKESSPYNACEMSCHIDKSEFPSYY